MSYRNAFDNQKTSLVVLELSALEEMLKQTIGKAFEDVVNLKPIKTAFEDVELMDMEEAVNFLKVSKVTIHNWKKKGIIRSHKMGRKLYFKKGELMEAIKHQKYSF